MTARTFLWLIRHAPVRGGEGVIHHREAEADLSSHDRIRRLARQLPEDATCFCSPARRTRQTAAALGLEFEVEPLLREQDFGDWTGRRHDDLAAARDRKYAAFWSAPGTNHPPGGESFTEQVARTRRALERMPEGHLILAVHSGTIRATLCIALAIDPERALSFVIDPLSLTRLDLLPGGWRVEFVNATDR